MHDSERFKLLGGPYAMPRCKVGRTLRCRMQGKVRVAAISDALIQWPQAYRPIGGGRLSLVLTGSLVRAVKRESEIAVAHWWGVHIQTVWKWRKVLGVEQNNKGTLRLRKELAPEFLTPEVTARARELA